MITMVIYFPTAENCRLQMSGQGEEKQSRPN